MQVLNFSVSVVADALGISRYRLLQMLERGKIACVRTPGGQIRIPRKSLRAVVIAFDPSLRPAKALKARADDTEKKRPAVFESASRKVGVLDV